MTEREEVKNNENIMDIDLSATKKRKFRIDGDITRILELDIADLGIVGRLADTYPKLAELEETANGLVSDEDSEDTVAVMKKFGDTLKEIDSKMREYIDYIFDSNVSEVACPSGSMCDFINGTMRYDYITTQLLKLYENNMDEELKAIKKNTAKHTAKYTKKKTTPKKKS